MSLKTAMWVFPVISLIGSTPVLARDHFGASAGTQQSYDTNIDQYDYGMTGERESAVTRVFAKIDAHLQRDNLSLKADYQPEYSWYWNASSENHFKHAMSLNLSAQQGDLRVESNTSLTQIDGSGKGLFFFGPGGAPCYGGVAVRDRRDQWLGKQMLSLRYDWASLYVRGVGTAYYHDFQTQQLSTPFYQNYADRSEYTGGVDVGIQVADHTYVTLGYRYGQQYQSDVLTNPTDFSNSFNRFLIGIEGKPTSWLTINCVTGPDLRNLGPDAAAGSDDTFNRIYVEGTATIRMSDEDQIMIMVKRFDQPSFGGRGMYTDSNYNIRYSHTFTSHWSVALEGRLLGGVFEKPANRDDWIYTTSVSATYQINEKLTLAGIYTYEWGDSNVPDTAAREFDRSIMGLSGTIRF